MAGPNAREESDYWLALSRVPGFGPRRLWASVDWLGSARAVWEADESTLARIPLLTRQTRSSLIAERERAENSPAGLCSRLAADTAAAFFAALRREGIEMPAMSGKAESGNAPSGNVVTCLDEAYPAGLMSTPDRPAVLFLVGDPAILAGPAVSVVGTRGSTPYGERVARRLVEELAGAGLVIVSGLAQGIDAVAHRAALEAGGKTVAVLGSGHGTICPRANAGLARDIVAGGGAVISQFPPDTLPFGGRFVRRNSVVAGFSLGVVVAEAPLGSGALITARAALELGRPVFAVPGPATSPASEGCLELIRAGARAVGRGSQVLTDLGLAPDELAGPPGEGPAATGAGRKAEHRSGLASLTGEARAVLGVMVDGETLPFAMLMARAGLPAERLGAVLGLLEVRGLVKRQPGEQYTRTSARS